MICPCKISTSGYIYRLHTPECSNRRQPDETFTDWVLGYLKERDGQ